MLWVHDGKNSKNVTPIIKIQCLRKEDILPSIISHLSKWKEDALGTGEIIISEPF